MSRARDDRGVTAIFLAVILVGLMALVGLVIDGSNAYAQRRQMQNAADTAATAGTNALQLFRQGEATADKISVEALAAVGANGAKTDASFTCELVRLDSSGTEIGTVPALPPVLVRSRAMHLGCGSPRRATT